MDLIHEALQVQELVPSNKSIKYSHFGCMIIELTLKESHYALLYYGLLLQSSENTSMRRDTQKSKHVCTHHSELPIECHIIDVIESITKALNRQATGLHHSSTNEWSCDGR